MYSLTTAATALLSLGTAASGLALAPQPRDIGHTYSISNIVYKSSPASAPAFNGFTHQMTFSFSDTNQPIANRVQTCTATYNPVKNGGSDPNQSIKCAPDSMYSFNAAADTSNGPAGTLVTIYLFHHFKLSSNPIPANCPYVTIASVNALLETCDTNTNNDIGVCSHVGSLPADNYSQVSSSTSKWVC